MLEGALTVVGDLLAGVFERSVEDTLDEGDAAAAAGACLGTGLDLVQSLAFARLDRLHDVTLRNVVTRAYLRVVGPISS